MSENDNLKKETSRRNARGGGWGWGVGVGAGGAEWVREE